MNTTCPGSVFPSQGHGVSQGGESTPGCGVKSPHKAEGLHPEDTQTHRITETACTFPSSPYLYSGRSDRHWAGLLSGRSEWQ